MRTFVELAKDAVKAKQHDRPFRVSPAELHYMRHEFATNENAEHIWDDVVAFAWVPRGPLHEHPLSLLPVVVDDNLSDAS